MGRQVQLYERDDDLDAFVTFASRNDSVVVCSMDSVTPAIVSVPYTSTRMTLVLWNQALCPALTRKRVEREDGSIVYQIPLSSPTIELTTSMSAKWEGQDALLMGRIYSFGFADQPPAFKAWYASLAGWLGRHFQSVSAAGLRAAIGPAAHEWFCRGGVLLPGFLPPATPAWKDVVRHQESLRCERLEEDR